MVPSELISILKLFSSSVICNTNKSVVVGPVVPKNSYDVQSIVETSAHYLFQKCQSGERIVCTRVSFTHSLLTGLVVVGTSSSLKFLFVLCKRDLVERYNIAKCLTEKRKHISRFKAYSFCPSVKGPQEFLPDFSTNVTTVRREDHILYGGNSKLRKFDKLKVKAVENPLRV